MRNHQSLIIGVALLFIGIAGLNLISGVRMYSSGIMGGMMMDGKGMKEMMQNMMGARLPPGIEANDLPDAQSKGAQLLTLYCAQCHELPAPAMHAAEQWPAVVDRMNQRMQMMSGRGMMHTLSVPSNSELQTLVIYLQKHAQRAIDKTQYKDLATPAGHAFESTCSQCHALPDPKQHTANEWPDVIQRMTQNMKLMDKTIPNRETLKSIIEWLQGHAIEPRPEEKAIDK
jgi:cytochrome c2